MINCPNQLPIRLHNVYILLILILLDIVLVLLREIGGDKLSKWKAKLIDNLNYIIYLNEYPFHPILS